jgi:hypothetical protein
MKRAGTQIITNVTTEDQAHELMDKSLNFS